MTKTEPAPLLSEVEAAVKQMKLGKAAGLDGYQVSSSVMPDHHR